MTAVHDQLSWKARVEVVKWDPDTASAFDLSAISAEADRKLKAWLRRQPRAVRLAAHRGLLKPGVDRPLNGHETCLALIRPDDVIEAEGNLLVNAGIQRLEDLLIGAGGQAYNAANSRIGVGTATTAAAATDTDLGAATGAANRQWEVMQATYPSRASQTVSWQSQFASGEANFAFQEWGIDQGTASSVGASTTPLLNHKIQGLGTKVSGAVWTVTATIAVS